MKRKTGYSIIFAVLLVTSVAMIGYVNSAAAIKTFNLDTSKSGMLRTDNVKYMNQYYVGDATYDEGMRAFLTFDISEISSGVNIDSVELDITNYTEKGDPFGDLGRFYVDGISYGSSLDTSDYYLLANPIIASYTSAPSSKLSNSSLTSYIENVVSGSGTAQFRLRFYKKTDNDGHADDLVFSNITLTIAWSTPPLTPTPSFTYIPPTSIGPFFLPDLTVADIYTNSSGNIAFKIANTGNGSISSSSSKIKVYKNGVSIFSSDMLLTISAGGTLTLNLSGSSAKVTGTDEVKVIVDADDDIIEWNDDNNELTETLVESGTPAPTTAAPTTSAPTTAAPTTAAPTTAAPTTSAPTTAAPTTEAPRGRFSVSKPEYNPGEAVEIYLESTGTTPIQLPNAAPWTVYRVEDGLYEAFRPTAAEVITEVTDQITWRWNQKDNADEPVPQGRYKIVLRTLNAGEYSATFVISSEEQGTSPPSTGQTTTQPQPTEQETSSTGSSLLENPIVLVGGAVVLLLLVLIIIVAMKK